MFESHTPKMLVAIGGEKKQLNYGVARGIILNTEIK